MLFSDWKLDIVKQARCRQSNTYIHAKIKLTFTFDPTDDIDCHPMLQLLKMVYLILFFYTFY